MNRRNVGKAVVVVWLYLIVGQEEGVQDLLWQLLSANLSKLFQKYIHDVKLEALKKIHYIKDGCRLFPMFPESPLKTL